jgi:hypothetical protein
MNNAKSLLTLGLIVAFIGVWLPYVYIAQTESSMSLTYHGWSVLTFFNNADTRFATGIGHILPFLVVGLSYAASIILVALSKSKNSLLGLVAILVFNAVLLHLLLLGVGWASIYSAGIFDVGFWNIAAPALGTYISIAGIALSLVGIAGWTLDAYSVRGASN